MPKCTDVEARDALLAGKSVEADGRHTAQWMRLELDEDVLKIASTHEPMIGAAAPPTGREKTAGRRTRAAVAACRALDDWRASDGRSGAGRSC